MLEKIGLQLMIQIMLLLWFGTGVVVLSDCRVTVLSSPKNSVSSVAFPVARLVVALVGLIVSVGCCITISSSPKNSVSSIAFSVVV